MPPIQAIHLLILAGVSLAIPTDAEHTKSGAHSHNWKLKLKKKTSTTLIMVCVTQKAWLIGLP